MTSVTPTAAAPQPPSSPAVSVGSRWSFAHPPREGQSFLMKWMDTAPEEARVLNVEAPTGVGKSPIGAAFASARKAAILVPQNMLQGQYLRDWPAFKDLRGSARYTCRSTSARSSANDNLTCQRKTRCGGCPYMIAKGAFQNCPEEGTGLTSYAMFFAMLAHDPGARLAFPWLVLDESHNLDESIISASEVAFSESEYQQHCRSLFPLPSGQLDSERARDLLEGMETGLRASVADAPDESREALRWEQLADAITAARANLYQGDDWVCAIEDAPRPGYPRRFWAKPTSPRDFFERHLWPYNLLAMSATPANREAWRTLFGVEGKEYAEQSVQSPFPVDNRPIYFRPVTSMAKRNYADGLPVMARALSRVMSQFPEDKGIVHCVSFKLATDLYNLLPASDKRRVLLHGSGSKVEILKTYEQSREPVLLMSPSITEGLDLKDDDGRLNVIVKMPYPSLGDPWVQRRRAILPGWYEQKTCSAVAQAVGRTTRHEDDWSTTVILDSGFERLYNENKLCFPDWFAEALQ